jgi:hypothetical protein
LSLCFAFAPHFLFAFQPRYLFLHRARALFGRLAPRLMLLAPLLHLALKFAAVPLRDLHFILRG